MNHRVSPFKKMNVFHLLLFKDHRLLLSGMLLLSFCPVSNANPTEQECHKEQIGVWTGNLVYKSGMNVSIDGGQDSWSKVVLQLQGKGDVKAKVLVRRNGDDLKVDGIGITFSNITAPQGFLWNSNKLTMNFDMAKEVHKMIVWNDTSSFTFGFNRIKANIDSLRIYSNKTISSYSQTIISICNSDTVTGTGEERGKPKTESPPDAMTECPTRKPCPAPEEKICPLCPETSCPSTPPCPTMTEEKICPLCPETSCPSTPPCPTMTEEKICPLCPETSCPPTPPCPTMTEEKICPLCPETSCPSTPPCPTMTVPCPPIATTYQENPDDNKVLHDHIRNNTSHQDEEECFQTAIFLEGWDRWIMYGLAAGCTAFLLLSVALAIALCKVGRRCAKIVNGHTSANCPLQLHQMMDCNNLDKVSGAPLGLVNDTNQGPSHNLHIPGNQPPNDETTFDDFDSDPEEWNNQDPIYANCGYFGENLPPAHNEYEQDENRQLC